MDRYSTHDVANQTEALVDYSLFDTDTVLQEGVAREGASDALPALREHGLWLGSAAVLAAGHDANRFVPELTGFDAVGHRVDAVAFHPAWHLLMHGIVGRGLHSGPLVRPQPGAQVARAAFYLMQGQVEAGTLCPTTMTFASLAVLKDEPAGDIDFSEHWLPALASLAYDPADKPITEKRGALIGMGLTEKQGGSDLRATSTVARPLGGPGRGRPYRLLGHKWFLSVPQADAHLMLARTEEGLSCFFVPRWTPDGKRNAVRIQRLKDKLGNRSNATGEVELCDAWGVLVGEAGEGLATLLKMIAFTRLDCVLGSAALLRQAVVQASHHGRSRHVSGALLIDQPLMRHVLADLALESEAASTLALRLAAAFEKPDDPLERAMRRIVTPAAKFWVGKRAITGIAECLEACGGNGYVEAGPLPRLLREAPVNAIWEGASNVMGLDVVRGLQRDEESWSLLVAELRNCVGINAAYDHALDQCLALCADTAHLAFHARRIAGLLALLVQSSLLLRHAPAYVWEPFLTARLGTSSWTPGDSLPTSSLQASVGLVLERAWAPLAVA